jgi:hypothetical protein
MIVVVEAVKIGVVNGVLDSLSLHAGRERRHRTRFRTLDDLERWILRLQSRNYLVWRALHVPCLCLGLPWTATG